MAAAGTARARVAAQVRWLRIHHHGWTQAQLAERCGIDERQIRYIENGANVQLDTLDQLAAGLVVDVGRLLEPRADDATD